jgi:hypothetical protein
VQVFNLLCLVLCWVVRCNHNPNLDPNTTPTPPYHPPPVMLLLFFSGLLVSLPPLMQVCAGFDFCNLVFCLLVLCCLALSLCCAVLLCVVFCCVIVCCILLCCSVFCCVVWCCCVLWCVVVCACFSFRKHNWIFQIHMQQVKELLIWLDAVKNKV